MFHKVFGFGGMAGPSGFLYGLKRFDVADLMAYGANAFATSDASGLLGIPGVQGS